jgi:hypothetical protein
MCDRIPEIVVKYVYHDRRYVPKTAVLSIPATICPSICGTEAGSFLMNFEASSAHKIAYNCATESLLYPPQESSPQVTNASRTPSYETAQRTGMTWASSTQILTEKVK